MSIFSKLCAEIRAHIAYLFNIYFKVKISIKLGYQFYSDKDINDEDQNLHYKTSIRRLILIDETFRNNKQKKLISLLNFALKIKSEI